MSKEYHPADEMRCPVHFCTGQEVIPSVLNQLLEKDDYLFSHHRSHGYYLAKKSPAEKTICRNLRKKNWRKFRIGWISRYFLPKKKIFLEAQFWLDQSLLLWDQQ